jgi:lysophospholipase L1-like esterase
MLALNSLIGGAVLFTACSSDPGAKPPVGTTDGGVSNDGQAQVDGSEPISTMEDGVSVIGRADTLVSDKMTGEGIQMTWPGVQLRVKFKGTEVRAGFNEAVAPGRADLNLATLSEYLVIVDDKIEKNIALKDGPNTDIELWKGADGEHTLVLYRKTESGYGTTRFNGFTFPNGGAIQPIARPGRKLLFIGDSIIAGYGADKIGPYDALTSEPPNPAATCPANLYGADSAAPTLVQRKNSTQALISAENNYVSFAARVGRTLKADTQIVALSGIGISRSRDPGDPTMEKIYNRVNADSSSRIFDPAGWQADAIVVNLGTNDFFGSQPGAVFQSKLEDFTKKLRSEYPNAVIVLMIGPMVEFNEKAKLVEYVQTTQTNLDMAGDKKIKVVEVMQNANKVGCEYHPTSDTHQTMGDAIAAEVKLALGWK